MEEACIDYTISRSASIAPSDSFSQNQLLATQFDPFLEPPKPKRQRRETSWVYTHFQQITLKEKIFFDKQTKKTKADIQYSCIYYICEELNLI